MLIAHLSDAHLGYSQFKLEEREEDVYNAFEQAIDISIREGVKAVILAGDIFHSPKPSGGALVRFGDQLKRLKDHQIRVFFVLGEHDISRIRGVPVPFAFHNLGFATYLKNGEVHEFDGILLIGFDKYRISEKEELIGRLRQADEEAKRFNGHRILVLHQGLLDISRLFGEIGSNDLPKNFTYYAMGHYHDKSVSRFDRLGGPVVYPGSIEITHAERVEERDKEKGFFIVDLSAKEPRMHWHRLDTRPQITLSAKYDELTKRVNELAESINGLPKKPMVCVNVVGKDIDTRKVDNILSKLAGMTLHYRRNLFEESASYSLLDERPADIEMELFELARKELGSEEVARFAINELLPLLEQGETKEAFGVVQQAYERFKKHGV